MNKNHNRQTHNSKIKINGLEKIDNKKVRFSKLDRATKIKNFVCIQATYQINVILPFMVNNYEPFALLPDGSKINQISIKTPVDSQSISKYVYGSRDALVHGQLHIFGGFYGHKKVMKKKEVEHIFYR